MKNVSLITRTEQLKKRFTGDGNKTTFGYFHRVQRNERSRSKERTSARAQKNERAPAPKRTNERPHQRTNERTNATNE